MSLFTTYAIIALAALIHTSFQISVSTFTLMSGHHFGQAKSHRAFNRLAGGFLLGVFTMTTLLLSSVSLFTLYLTQFTSIVIAWAAACGLAAGIGAAVWLFYYPRGKKGTELWLPRKSAIYLADRSKHTTNSGESFGLGLMSVFAEGIFLSAPLFITAISLVQYPATQQLIGIGLYVALSMSSLLIAFAIVGSGHKISRLQQWREKNKTFLQFISGTALFVLGFSIYIYYVYPYTWGVAS